MRTFYLVKTESGMLDVARGNEKCTVLFGTSDVYLTEDTEVVRELDLDEQAAGVRRLKPHEPCMPGDTLYYGDEWRMHIGPNHHQRTAGEWCALQSSAHGGDYWIGRKSRQYRVRFRHPRIPDHVLFAAPSIDYGSARFRSIEDAIALWRTIRDTEDTLRPGWIHEIIDAETGDVVVPLDRSRAC